MIHIPAWCGGRVRYGKTERRILGVMSDLGNTPAGLADARLDLCFSPPLLCTAGADVDAG